MKLLQLPDPTLFYPASGRDIDSVVQHFAPRVRQFWFVDLAYFSGVYPFSQQPPVLHHRDFELVNHSIRGNPNSEIQLVTTMINGQARQYRDINPSVRTERYRHGPSGQEIHLHLRKGFGTSGLKAEIQRLGVFFYRGDSSDGGSGTHWLTASRRDPGLMGEVLSRLTDDGLIVTDGSNCRWGPYTPFRDACASPSSVRDAVDDAFTFADYWDNRFTCEGVFGERHNRTALIWRVKKAALVSSLAR